VLFDVVEELDFVGPWEIFTFARQLDPETCDVFTVSERGGEVRCAKGLRVVPDHTFDDHPPLDVLLVPGGMGTRREVANAKLIDWMLYSQVMPAADVVICHGGHGTVATALAAGAPLLVCPFVGDMAENAARVTWSGAGLSVPRRLLSRHSIRLATRRLLGEPRFTARAREIAAWSGSHDGAPAAADLVEDTARNATSRLSPARVKSS
jgi:putative intracellular protease/amidase